MTVPDLPASRREVDLLREEVHRLDDHGTRGVLAMQSQLTELVKDMTELKTEVNNRFGEHQQMHDKIERERRSGRQWMVGTAIAALLLLVAIITLLFQISGRVH